MATSSLVLLLLLLLLVFVFGTVPGAHAFSEKCPACRAVAAELEIGLLNERPRNHLDMRHRLNSQGHREGKLIDYKVSELRVVELLDGLCSRMRDYTLGKTEDGKDEWTKQDMSDSIRDRREADAYSKQITTYCGRLLERTEEELEERIKNGSMKYGDVEKTLCSELAQECSSSSNRSADVEETEDGEL